MLKMKVCEYILTVFIANYVGRMHEEKRFQLIHAEKSEVDNENVLLRQQLSQRNDEIDRLNSKVMELEHETSQVGVLRSKIDELMNKNHQKDQTTREKEENMFNYKREVESLGSDIRNMEHIENTLKNEIEDLLEKRKTLEDINQNLKNQICECNIAIRQIASSFDSVKRENMALTSNIEIFRRSEEQLREENSNLKELINNIESERIHYRAVSEQLQRELAYTKRENASFAANESKLSSYSRSDQEPQYQAPRYDDYSGPSNGNEMANYQFMLPQNEGSGHQTPLHGRDANSPNFEESYQPLNMPANTPPRYSGDGNMPPQLSPHGDKSPLKLPMHLASSVSFNYPDQFDQYYRKNQTAGPPPVMNMGGPPPQDNKRREGAQKAYFGSHLDNIFDWNNAQNNAQKNISQTPSSHPSAETSLGHQQTLQGFQGQDTSLARELTQTVPPKSEMNKQQKHMQIMKLENALLTFQMDKDKITNELQKIPDSHRLNHNHKQKIVELERNSEVLDKNINTVKLKLRDIKH
jgi:predicted  nucleic acid-binding Zn-ribbon protein